MDNRINQKISLVFGGVSAERDLSLRAFNSIYQELRQQTNPKVTYQNVYYIKEDGLVIKKPFNHSKGPDFYMKGCNKAITVPEALQEIKKNDEYVFSLHIWVVG